jgi:hypothetical protein
VVVSDQHGQQQAAQNMHNMAQRACSMHPSLLSDKVGNSLGSDNQQDTGDLSTVTAAVTNHMHALPVQVAQAVTGLLSTDQSANRVFTLHFYQRLPHALSHLLKELPVVDGADLSLLCDFLLKVLNP